MSRRHKQSRIFAAAGLLVGAALPMAALALYSVGPWVTVGFGVASAASLAALGRWLGQREEDLVARSMRDPLTGLWNRAAFDERLQAELGRASRNRRPLALIMVDLDRLKKINDRHGHPAGDAAIVHVAESLLSSCRTTDVACRIGGDEFAIIAPDTDRRQAGILAERIRKGAALFPVRLEHGSVGVSVSVGVVDVLPTAPLPAAQLLKRADELLYAAKTRGRNRVVVGNQRVPRPTFLTPPVRMVPNRRIA